MFKTGRQRKNWNFCKTIDSENLIESMPSSEISCIFFDDNI